MVKVLDSIPWRERQWGHAGVRNAIAAKQKLGLGLDKKKLKWRQARGIFVKPEGVSGAVNWQQNLANGLRKPTKKKIYQASCVCK